MFLTIIIFLAALGLLVLVHEAGHFFIAKKLRIGVEEFGLGFPPRLFGWQRFSGHQTELLSKKENIEVEISNIQSGDKMVVQEVLTDKISETIENVPLKKWRFIWGKQNFDSKISNEQNLNGGTIYSLNWIPLGGFVKIKGENGEDALEPDSFAAQKKWARALVLAGGVLMNVILAFFIFSLGFMHGLPASVDNSDGRYNGHLSDNSIKIAGVMKKSPAERVGLKLGDQIVAVAGISVNSAEQVINYVEEHQDETSSMEIITVAGQTKTLNFTPDFIAGQNNRKVLGVNIIQAGILRYGFWESWYQGGAATVQILGQIFSAFGQLIKNLLVGHGLNVDLTGPVGVAVMTGQAKDLGWIYLWQFVAMLSLNLAVVNILPFPALDGGRLLFLLIETIRRKPNNQKVEAITHNLGFALLMVLVIAVTYKDVARYGIGMIDKIKQLF